MKRQLAFAVAGYLAFAIAGRLAEGRGSLTCLCEGNCWCKRPGISLFRWVFPFGHAIA